MEALIPFGCIQKIRQLLVYVITIPWLLLAVQESAIASEVDGAYPLPGAWEGNEYRVMLPASGGLGPYTFEIKKGRLPAALELDRQSGELTGLLQEHGEFRFMVSAVDQLGNQVQKAVLLRVGPPQTHIKPLVIRTDSLPSAIQNQVYRMVLAAFGGVAGYKWHLYGALPNGLEFDTDTGIIQGIPQDAASTSFRVEVQDSQPYPARAVQELQLRVLPSRETDLLSNWWKYIGLAVIVAAYFLLGMALGKSLDKARDEFFRDGGEIHQTDSKQSLLSGPDSVQEAFIQAFDRFKKHQRLLKIGSIVVALLFIWGLAYV